MFEMESTFCRCLLRGVRTKPSPKTWLQSEIPNFLSIILKSMPLAYAACHLVIYT
jgi:hypothetical protein